MQVIHNTAGIDKEVYNAIVKNMVDTATENFITVEEKNSLENELQELKEVKRPEVIEQLKVARSYGDLSENAEYDAARKSQGIIESRIVEIENTLRTATVADGHKEKNTVTIGTSVEVKINGKEKKIYDIGTSGRGIEVSVHSPIAAGLLGNKVGETVKVTIPKGDTEMTIQKIW